MATHPRAGLAQLSPSAVWAAGAPAQHQVFANVVYQSAYSRDARLDIYQRREPGPHPTILFMHGGFWAAGAKETSLLSLIPWLEMGWNVVNVEYRRAPVAPAPAAVQDCRCALRFIAAHAEIYGVDAGRIVLSGESAGGHLALLTGMIPKDPELDAECDGDPLPRAAAILNWYGVADVADVIEGPHKSDLAAQWVAGLPNPAEIARRLSPLGYVRPGLPPVLTVHGDSDVKVPYDHAVRLHKALAAANVPNRLVTVPNAAHGGFTAEARTKIYLAIREFLSQHGLGAA